MFEIRRLERLSRTRILKSKEVCSEEPLTLALSRRERGLIGVAVVDTPT
jgi:hypothetical protein